MNIPITRVFMDHNESDAVAKVLASGWLVQGPNVKKFEQLFAEFTKSAYAIANANCTTSLHLCLEALGIGDGDKVIVPSFTYVASANAVEYTGAKVVFCDIDLKTFNIDEIKMEQLLAADSSIKAIMPVNLFGLCANMPEIMKIAKKYNVYVVEDSACGFDGWIGKQHSGTFGDMGCFSFHPRKSICTGEGGMIITNNQDLANLTNQLRDHGASKSDLQRHKEKGGSLLPDFNMRGYNYRMTDMQGAIGVCQMDKARAICDARKNIAKKYDAALSTVKELVTPFIPDGYIHGYQSYVCTYTDGLDLKNLTKQTIDELNVKRNIFMDKLEAKNIATRQGTHAVHTLSYYKKNYNLHDEDYLMSYAADRLSIALPVYYDMTDEEFNYVITNIKEAI